MSAAHIPAAGSWAVNLFCAQVDSADLCDDGSLVPVCLMLWPTPYRDEQTTEAHARLIAAAPDLLAALRGAIGALEFWRDFHSDDGSNADIALCQDKLDAARAAIAKAETR